MYLQSATEPFLLPEPSFDSNRALADPKKIDKQRSFFLFHDKYKFEQRLEIKIKKIFENEKIL